MASSVLLVEPETLVRNLLARTLLGESIFDVVLETSSFNEAVKILKQQPPQLMITEVALADASGIELVRKAKTEFQVRSIILSGAHELSALQEEIDAAGALAAIPKIYSLEGLLSVISKALTMRTAEKIPLPKSAPMETSDSTQRKNSDCAANTRPVENSTQVPQTPDPLDPLTPREREVFHLLTNGLKNVEIAKRLFISTRTVETHRARLSKKLKLKSSIDLLRYAVRHGLVEI